VSRFPHHLIPWLLPLLLLGCSGDSSNDWNSNNITGFMPALQFQLTNENGQAVTAEDYDGKITMMFFGYTSCPHVCPVALRKLAAAARGLGDQADEVQILFVAVDPKRDQKVLDEYVSNFTPELVGLTGTQEQLKKVTKRYRVAYSYEKPQDDGFYVVNHSSAVFVFDAQRQARLLIDEQANVAKITEDLRHLIAESAG